MRLALLDPPPWRPPRALVAGDGSEGDAATTSQARWAPPTDNAAMSDHPGTRRLDPRSDLRADCERCVGLCCVAPAFSASADFAIDKAAGRPCPNLPAGLPVRDPRQPAGRGVPRVRRLRLLRRGTAGLAGALRRSRLAGGSRRCAGDVRDVLRRAPAPRAALVPGGGARASRDATAPPELRSARDETEALAGGAADAPGRRRMSPTIGGT